MKTLVYTAWKAHSPDDSGKPRCIFNGDVPHLLRAGDQIVVKDGFCVEKIDRVYYDLINNTQEVHLVTSDINNEYPTVDFH